MKNVFAAIIAACILICHPALAQKKHELPNHTIVFNDEPGWHKISEILIDAKSDSNIVPVRGLHKFRAFRLFATEAGVRVNQIRIFYENGTVTDTTLSLNLKEGETSRQFKIYKSSTVRGIVYICRPKDDRKKPHLWLYGFI